MGKRELALSDSLNALIFGLLAVLLGSFLCASLLILTHYTITGRHINYDSITNSAKLYTILTICTYSLLFLVFICINKNKDNTIIRKPSIKKILIFILIGILINLILTPIISIVDFGLDKLGAPQTELGYELNNQNYLISIFSLALLPAIFEELLFRGLIFKGLKRSGKVFSITTSAIMFTLFHMSIRQTLYPLLFGLALGLVMYEENNIIYCMILHFVNNLTTLTLSYLNFSISLGFIIYLVIAIILVVAYLSLMFRLVLKNNSRQAYLTKSERITFIVTLLTITGVWAISIFIPGV